MPKRPLAVRNNENEQQQASRTTRSSSKHESNPPKRSKKEEEPVEQENIPPGCANLLGMAVPFGLVRPVIEMLVQNGIGSTLDDDDDEEEEIEDIQPVSNTDTGEVHPKNKQYIIYKSTEPNKEDFIISKTARYWNQKYRKALPHVNPDYYGIYIHNDFSCYGELEVVENCLSDLTKSIFLVQQNLLNRPKFTRKSSDKINYILAYRRLESLTILLNNTDGISGIDDGERFYAIMRVIGACYVTILRGLLPKIMFGKIETIDEILVKKLTKISQQIPNFKQVLELAMIVGHQFITMADVCTAYTKILQTVYCNWVLIMEKVSIDFNQQPNSIKAELWKSLKHATTIDPNNLESGADEEFFDFMEEVRLYTEEYGLGGDSHDISKWSRRQREQYSLDRFDDFMF